MLVISCATYRNWNRAILSLVSYVEGDTLFGTTPVSQCIELPYRALALTLNPKFLAVLPTDMGNILIAVRRAIVHQVYLCKRWISQILECSDNDSPVSCFCFGTADGGVHYYRSTRALPDVLALAR